MIIRKLIGPAIGLYLLGIVLYFFEGDNSQAWTVGYYGLEKLFSASGYFFLALCTQSRFIMRLSLYAGSLCLFLFCYFIYCYQFGHSSVFAVGALLLYSIFVVYLLNKKNSKI